MITNSVREIQVIRMLKENVRILRALVAYLENNKPDSHVKNELLFVEMSMREIEKMEGPK